MKFALGLLSVAFVLMQTEFIRAADSAVTIRSLLLEMVDRDCLPRVPKLASHPAS